MNGGAGYDTYLIEGHDTIEDSDGNGRIRDKAGNFISGVIEKQTDRSYVYVTDPTIGVTRDANLTLTWVDSASVVLDDVIDRVNKAA